MKKGTIVRITAGQLALMSDPDDGVFTNEVLRHGETATWQGPHPRKALADQGWDVLSVERGGRTMWCPVHDSHFVEDQPPVQGLRSLLP